MSGFDGSLAENSDLNPFADPKPDNDRKPQTSMNDFETYLNPFNAKSQNVSVPLPSQPSTHVSNPNSQPPIPTNINFNKTMISGDIVNSDMMQTQQNILQAQKELHERQKELEKKAAELERKERELKSHHGFAARQNNWPPLPKFVPLQPCFYQDIEVEIPLEFQKIVKTLYYIWLGYILVISLNMVASLAAFITGGSVTLFGLSILWLILFTPCSFLCWFRPAYKAFRSDSSFNFFLFFFVFFCQFCINVIQAIGIDNFGTCGWVNSLGHLRQNKAAALFMFLVAAGFTALASLGFILLLKVHKIYRSTGASFAKAQQEFASGFMSNPTVREAGWNVATGMAAGTIGQQSGGDTYGTAARY